RPPGPAARRSAWSVRVVFLRALLSVRGPRGRRRPRGRDETPGNPVRVRRGAARGAGQRLIDSRREAPRPERGAGDHEPETGPTGTFGHVPRSRPVRPRRRPSPVRLESEGGGYRRQGLRRPGLRGAEETEGRLR